MNRSLRFASIFALAALAAASQAVVFSFGGSNLTGGSLTTAFTTTPPPGPSGSGAPFTTVTAGLVNLAARTVVFSSSSGDTVTVSFPTAIVTTSGTLTAHSGFGAITGGTGVFQSYISPLNTLTITSNTFINPGATTGINYFSVLGDVNPVPEPASMAALAVGALGLLRRRRKA